MRVWFVVLSCTAIVFLSLGPLVQQEKSYKIRLSTEYIFYQRGVLLDTNDYQCAINIFAQYNTIVCAHWWKPWNKIEFTLLPPQIYSSKKPKATKKPDVAI